MWTILWNKSKSPKLYDPSLIILDRKYLPGSYFEIFPTKLFAFTDRFNAKDRETEKDRSDSNLLANKSYRTILVQAE